MDPERVVDCVAAATEQTLADGFGGLTGERLPMFSLQFATSGAQG